MLLAAEELFHQKVSEELQIDGAVGQRGVDTRPEVSAVIASGYFLQGPGKFMKTLGEVAVAEFRDVDIHEPPVIGVVVNDFTGCLCQLAEAVGVELPQQGLQLHLHLAHARGIAPHQADVEGFLVRVVIVDIADRDPGLAGNVADGRAEVALPDEEPEGGLFDGGLVPLDDQVLEFGHKQKRSFVFRILCEVPGRVNGFFAALIWRGIGDYSWGLDRCALNLLSGSPGAWPPRSGNGVGRGLVFQKRVWGPCWALLRVGRFASKWGRRAT